MQGNQGCVRSYIVPSPRKINSFGLSSNIDFGEPVGTTTLGFDQQSDFACKPKIPVDHHFSNYDFDKFFAIFF